VSREYAYGKIELSSIKHNVTPLSWSERVCAYLFSPDGHGTPIFKPIPYIDHEARSLRSRIPRHVVHVVVEEARKTRREGVPRSRCDTVRRQGQRARSDGRFARGVRRTRARGGREGVRQVRLACQRRGALDGRHRCTRLHRGDGRQRTHRQLGDARYAAPGHRSCRGSPPSRRAGAT